MHQGPRTSGALITEGVSGLPDGQQPGVPSGEKLCSRGEATCLPRASPHLHGLLEQVGPGLHPVLDALQLCLVLSKALSLLAPVGRRPLGS